VTSLKPDYVEGLAVYRGPAESHQPTVVLVHGSMDRAAAFRRAARLVRDLDVTLYDRRGYGRSVNAGTVDTIDGLVDDVLTVVGDRPSMVIGHSLGGVIALAAAQRAPGRVLAVGAFEAPMAWRPWWPRTSAGGAAREAADSDGPEAAAEQFMRRLVGDARWEDLPEGTRRQRRSEGRALLADLKAMQSDPVPFDGPRISVPVVAGYGTATSERHRRAAGELATDAAIGELIRIEGATHNAHYTHPAEFSDFIGQVARRGAARDC
jgi:pimeloyl-ACP methyl ester carboxylesterase